MSKTKTNQIETAGSDPVIAQFRRYRGVLMDTGSSIPKLLQEQHELRQELGRAEISGNDIHQTKERLDTVAAALASAGRQRAAASEGLLAIAGELREARASVTLELAEMAQSVVSDFQLRWAHAVTALSRLHAEASLLSRALRAEVVAAPPYTTSLSADGTRMNVVFSGHIEVDTVVLPPEIATITARADALDAAASLCAAVGQAKEWDSRYVALQRTRSGNMPVMSGLYSVIKPFDHLGRRFERGTLVDQSLMGLGVLHRRWQGKEIVPLEGAVTAAA